MTGEPPPTLDYVTVRYRHRAGPPMALLVLLIGAALMLALLWWRGIAVPRWGQALAVGIPAALLVLTGLPALRSECRVEGNSLWFRFGGRRPISVPLDNVIAIDRIEMPERGTTYELVVRDRGRMAVQADVFEPIEPLKSAVHEVNPGVRFGTHSGVHCRSCGAELFPPGWRPGLVESFRFLRQPTCPACGKPYGRAGRFL
jgi:hypothetical protein